MTALSLPTAPRLLTTNFHPIEEIERHIPDHQNDTDQLLHQYLNSTPVPFYASGELLNAGFKLAQIDTKLFPAEFNNLNTASKHLPIQTLPIELQRFCPDAIGFLIIPDHARNLYYLVTLREDIQAEKKINFHLGRKITLHPIQHTNNELSIGDFIPCAALLNNDLSGGRPEIMGGLKQSINLPQDLDWAIECLALLATAKKTKTDD